MNAPRDRSASRARHNGHVIDHESYIACYLESAHEAGEQDGLLRIPSELASALLCRYSRGDSVEELKEYFCHTYLPTLEQAWELGRPVHDRSALVLNREHVNSWMLLFALICFDEDGNRIRYPDKWFSKSSETALYSIALTGFIPDFSFSERYDVKRETIDSETEVLRILLNPRETWPAALASFLHSWPSLMKSRGYRDHVDDTTTPFNEFPFHVGIVVCAFDIDDAMFRELAWYPRDLVDYYRIHIRHTRDAWRTASIDPVMGLPESARPRPKRKRAISKADAYAGWLKLVCGCTDRLERVKELLGKRRTMPELFPLMEVLAASGLAIQADIKDDETVEAQLLALCAAHRLPPLELPAPPPHGPARISALLLALQAHAVEHGQNMAVLDDGDDSWNVVLHAFSQADEFEDLCEQLQVKPMADSDWE